jgi:hypothetical protein
LLALADVLGTGAGPQPADGVRQQGLGGVGDADHLLTPVLHRQPGADAGGGLHQRGVDAVVDVTGRAEVPVVGFELGDHLLGGRREQLDADPGGEAG